MAHLEIEDLGLLPYKIAWEYQQSIVQQKLNNPSFPDKLILVQHPPVYTLGTGATTENLKFDLNSFSGEIHRIERGGEVTYHYPGQIVAYPILNLRSYQQDLHWYLRQLEEVIICLLAKYDVKAERIKGLTGVWVNNTKIAAIGIKVKRWVTMHGFALNVNGDLSGFNQIIPCGIKDKGVTKLSNFLPNISVEDVKPELVETFINVFECS
ncbi:lipoyl(octanoyl) transferase LipB [Cyanobacterium aponinum UTEX 3222]|uniref:lipoyl(octanoyl) transferase LipB n=1 Tax=Cyanobacterium aponinum TaxID=379064 RepID=UPI00308C98A5|nr:lipoyl(octanoyl) transferase LipB [Cyanobacterium aponinum UTEX 3222]